MRTENLPGQYEVEKILSGKRVTISEKIIRKLGIDLKVGDYLAVYVKDIGIDSPVPVIVYQPINFEPRKSSK